MRSPRPVPPSLLGRAFHRDEAIRLGISARMLEHPRFVEVLPRVYRHTDSLMTPSEWVRAASLLLPPDAHVSHHTRFIGLGLEHGPLLPLHFTIARDHHIAVENVFLHRTIRLPETDAGGVCTAASLVGLASIGRLLDVIVVGDWLMQRSHLHLPALEHLLTTEPWRPGTERTAAALPHLEPRSLSVPESTVRALLCFAGLPRPLSNDDLRVDGDLLGRGDLVYRGLRLVIEYEGRHHALDPAQFQRDVHRYQGFRDADIAYVQVTHKMLRHPRAVVLAVHRAMVSRGYDGPAPSFGRGWGLLFEEPAPWRHRPRAALSVRR